MTEEQADATQRTTQPVAGRVLAGRYAIVNELGRGGMGVVWRAEDQVIGRHVAIKELRLPDSGEGAAVFQERVLREVRTGGRLNDPAVVTVYDVINADDCTYIVMELVEAPTLSDIVAERGPLSPDLVAMVGEQVLSALAAAHASGIVHRDVKPGNIMVAPNGRVKLTDFGIAQATDDPRLTTSGFLVGSPAFMAPERVAGRDANPASDIWSLGVTLYFAVEGTIAFERDTTAATLHAIMNEVPTLTRAQGPLASAIMSMLVTAPEARISAEQAQHLLSMARGQASPATPPAGQHTALYPGQAPTLVGGDPRYANGMPPQQRSPARRKATRIAAAITAVLLLVGGGLLGAWWASPSQPDMLETLSYGSGGDIETFSTPSRSGSECINTTVRAGSPLSESNWVDCEEPHVAEVYDYARALGDSDATSDGQAVEPPDAKDLRAFGEAKCAMSFRSGTIREDAPDDLQFRALVPSAELWSQEGDDVGDVVRSVLCVASRDGDAQLSGQVRATVY